MAGTVTATMMSDPEPSILPDVMILIDGAETECPAEVVEGVVREADVRYQVTLRTPFRPLVTGRVATE